MTLILLISLTEPSGDDLHYLFIFDVCLFSFPDLINDLLSLDLLIQDTKEVPSCSLDDKCAVSLVMMGSY